jgi:ABC-type transport system substrate-binding protein
VELVPWLAEEMPTNSRDGRTFTFRLRKGIRFSNGRELVAQDMVYTLERILDPKTRSPGEGFFRNIVGAREYQRAREKKSKSVPHVAGLEAPDRYTFRVQLRKPDLAFLNVMAMPFAYPVPKEAVEKYGEDFFVRPVGTGAFVLKEWRRGARLRFERNPRYYLKGQPYLDSIEVMVGGDDLIHVMMFERGELDLLNDIPSPDFIRITTDPKWKRCIATAPLNATTYLAMNCEMKPFDDVRVRRAISCAVDKARLLKLINDTAVAANGVLPPLMPGFNPRLKGYPHDPQKAKQLLAEAGYPDGFQVELWVSTSHSERVKMTEAIQQDLAKVGVKIDIKAVAFAMWDEASGRRKNTRFVFSGWYQDYPDPSNFLDVLLSGERIVDVHCNNVAFYNNPQVNRLLQLAGGETNPARRLGLYQQAEEIIVSDAPWVFLYHPYLYILYQPWVKGHKLHPVWPNRYERFWKA